MVNIQNLAEVEQLNYFGTIIPSDGSVRKK